MKYSRFEILALAVGACAVLATVLAAVSGANRASDIVGQSLILVALFAGLHYGRKGALVGFIACTGIYAIVAFTTSGSIDTGTNLQLFILRTAVYAVVAFVAGELNVRLKYLFIKLEHHDYVDNITSLYNAKYLGKLIEKYISEFDRYGSKFSLANFTVSDKLLEPMKKKTRHKLIRDIGNSIIRGNIRGADEAARLETTTFSVLYPNTNFDGANCATARVRSKIAGYLERHGLDAEKDEVILTEVWEYPRDKDDMEIMAVNMQDGRPRGV